MDIILNLPKIKEIAQRKNDLLKQLIGKKSHDDYSYYVKEREFRKDINMLRRRLKYIDRHLCG